MKIIRRGAVPIATGWVIANFPEGNNSGFPGLGATFFVKAMYRLRPGDTAIPWADAAVTGSGDVCIDGTPARGISYASDWVPHKPFGEFMAVGTAYGPPDEEARSFRVCVQIGRISKSIDVFGDRMWHTSWLGLHRPGPPAPVTSVPLRYDHAWGGPRYPYNPVGRGYRTPHMPNLEVPGDHASRSTAEAQPAGFAPIPPSWPQRSEKLRGPDGGWNRHRWPWLPEHFDYSFFNAAPPDQWVEGAFAGNEQLRCENMHREHAVYETRLPGMRARCFVARRVGEDDARPPVFCDVPVSLDTVWIDMDQEKLVLVWRGRTPVRSVKLRDIEALLVLLEPLGQPEQPLESYRAMMADAPDQSEAPPPPDRRRPDFQGIKADLEARTAALKKEIVDAESRAQEALRARPPGAVRATPPAAPGPPDMHEAVAAARLSGERQLARVREALRQNPAATPEQVEVAAHASERMSRGLADVLALPARFAARKADHEARLATAFPPQQAFDRHAFDSDKARRDGFRGAMLRGADFSGLDLAGVSFAGALLQEAKFVGTHLRGADFSGALLGGADLSGADLSDARVDRADLDKAVVTNTLWQRVSLTQTRLVRLDLTKADFTGATGERADFSAANLSDAIFRTARLPQARFFGAVLTNADFTQTLLTGADLGAVQAAGVRLTDSDISRVRAGHGATFTNADLRRTMGDGSIWKGAALTKATFQQASLVRARFAEATLHAAVFDRCNLAHAVFEDAQMHGAALTNANLLRAAFDRADLSDARFDGSNLYESGFWDAVLVRATWHGAEAVESLVEQVAWGQR